MQELFIIYAGGGLLLALISIPLIARQSQAKSILRLPRSINAEQS